jgi:hypothetical protein
MKLIGLLLYQLQLELTYLEKNAACVYQAEGGTKSAAIH